MWRTSKQPERDRAVLTIQRMMRGCLGRSMLARRHKAATKLQTWWRGRKAVCRYKAILKAKHLLRLLVFRWRWNREMHEQLVKDMEMAQHIRSMVVRIQKRERGVLCRRSVDTRDAAACVIQSVFRGVLTRRSAKNRYCALHYIQAHWDGAYQHCLFQKKLQCAIKIQAFMRGRYMRRKLLKRSRATCHIQRIGRGRFSKKRNELRRTKGLFIMRAIRAWLTAKRYRQQVQAVKLIQKRYRGSATRRHMAQRHAAASKIESMWKGFRTHSRYRRVHHAASVIVAGTWMWRHSRLWKSKVNAAIRIQAAWRGYCERMNQEYLHLSAKRLQKWYRDCKTCSMIQRVALEVLKVKKAMLQEWRELHMTIIQRCIRRWIQYRRGMYRTKRGITGIQARFRSWKAKREVAALRQHLGRLPPQHAYQVRKRQQHQIVRIVDIDALTPALRADLDKRVRLIQKHWFHYRFQRAAKKCQRLIRGGLARRRVRRMRLASVKLVCWWRRTLRARARDKSRPL
mmetsp:Transcript_35068/g.61037  ORF Transcript_35068/g.61037 Transcript_35068/m.61037 type:complete len:512 (+) Transcript_35068:636-2171(+)